MWWAVEAGTLPVCRRPSFSVFSRSYLPSLLSFFLFSFFLNKRFKKHSIKPVRRIVPIRTDPSYLHCIISKSLTWGHMKGGGQAVAEALFRFAVSIESEVTR